MAKLVVTSSSPLPRNRGGKTFIGAMAFEMDAFTEAQLREIAADSVLTVVVGDVLTEAGIDAMFAPKGGAKK